MGGQQHRVGQHAEWLQKYGRFRLDVERHLDLELVAPGMPGGPLLALKAGVE